MKTQQKAHEHFGRYSGTIPNTGPILCACGATMEYTGSFKEKCVREKVQARALAAYRKVEDGPAWKRAAAYIIVNNADAERWGKLKVAYPADGMGPLKAFLWCADEGGIQYGYASGCGYNKLAAALDGMVFAGITLKDGTWETQLREGGWRVIQAI